MKVIRRGAEAEIRRDEFMGRQVLVKSRVPKAYRHPALDQSLRAHRTRVEARLLQEARSCGVPTPIVYDLDTVNAEIWMQEIVGPRAKDALLKASPEDVRAISQEIGRMVARLHSHGMTHGDLTTSNMILRDGRVFFIDLSLGSKAASLEEMGVDLHLLREAFQSAHSDIMYAYDIIAETYAREYVGGKEVLAKVRDIEERGRYA
ncbi:MAG TPA: Kae1-associated serine/threonine protein kinase [Methanomassiliicoccales archaeon]|nr:Kae1-associated serine/threonine protein kinase [Methanomassiliicoccales archaeon]